METFYLGIDLGGSNISGALMTPLGEIVRIEKIETEANKGRKHVVERIISLAKKVQSDAGVTKKQVKALGIGVPGVIDVKSGTVKYSPNLPGWKNVHLKKELEKALKMKVAMDNDANAAAFGEKWLGAGKGYDDVVVYTLGTGVGGGIIMKGNLVHGSCDGAGELGHSTILPDGPKCGCGNLGCLESLVSGTGIAKQAMRALKDGRRSIMTRMSEGDNKKITAKLVFQAARQGDKLAQDIIMQTGRYLGIAVANIINLLNPQIIIIGGGVSIAGETLLKHVRLEAKCRALKDLYRCAKITRAKLADRAGVIGAVGIAIKMFDTKKARKGVAK